jgi:hypothetical protein
LSILLSTTSPTYAPIAPTAAIVPQWAATVAAVKVAAVVVVAAAVATAATAAAGGIAITIITPNTIPANPNVALHQPLS